MYKWNRISCEKESLLAYFFHIVSTRIATTPFQKENQSCSLKKKTPPSKLQYSLILNFPGGKLRFRAQELYLLAFTLTFPSKPWKRTQLESPDPPTAPLSPQKRGRSVPKQTETHRTGHLPRCPSSWYIQLDRWAVFLSLWESSKSDAAVTFLQSSGAALRSALGQDLPACYIIYAEQIAQQLHLKYNHSAICTC